MDEKLATQIESTSSTSSPAGTLKASGERDVGRGEGQTGGSRGPPKEILLPISRLLPLSIACVSLMVQDILEGVF